MSDILKYNYIMDTRKSVTKGNRRNSIIKREIKLDEVINYAIENGFLDSKKLCLDFTFDFEKFKSSGSFIVDVVTGTEFKKIKDGYMLSINKDFEDGKSKRPLSNFDYFIFEKDIVQLSMNNVDNSKEFAFNNVLTIVNKEISIWF